MTKLEVIRENKARYARIEKAIESMTGLEKAVAQNMTLKWAKGKNWLGGLSDREANKEIQKLMESGYDMEDIMNEFDRQMNKF